MCPTARFERDAPETLRSPKTAPSDSAASRSDGASRNTPKLPAAPDVAVREKAYTESVPAAGRARGSTAIQTEPAVPEEASVIGRPRSRKNWSASGARSSESGASVTETEPSFDVSGKSGAWVNPTLTVTGAFERFPIVRSDRKCALAAPVRSSTTGTYFADAYAGAT